MKSILVWIGGILAASLIVGMVLLIALGLRFGNLYIEGWFAPREANVQREIFENTKSYNEAKEQELLKTYKEYLTADESTKDGLKEYVSHAFADYEIERLDVNLQNFVRECRGF